MTNTTPTGLQARMEKLVRDMVIAASRLTMEYRHYEEAVRLAAELPKPIDPDETDALSIVSAWYGFEVLGEAPELATAKRRTVEAYKRIKADRA